MSENNTNPIDEVVAEAQETTEETTTKKTPKAKKAKGPQYPFRSKKSILEQVETDDTFAVQCLEIMGERTENRTPEQKAYGFMSSHATKGTALVAASRSEEGLTTEQLSEARTLVARYGKQLAAHFRAEAIEKDPKLAEVAKLFSAN